MDVFPSPEAAVRGCLAGNPDVQAIVGSHVYVDMPEDCPLPAIRVTRVGGLETQAWEDTARVQIEAWAALGDRATAEQLGRLCVAAVKGIRGAVAGGYAFSAEVVLGLSYMPDPLTSEPRYLFDVELPITYAS